ARVRHQHMIGVTAGPKGTQETRRRTELLLAAPAYGACTATDPGMRQALVADLDAGRLGPERHDLTHDLVPHGERERHAAVLQDELLPPAQTVPAVPDVEVTGDAAGRQCAQQPLTALGLWRRLLAHPKRRAEFDHIMALHGGPLLPIGEHSSAMDGTGEP